MPNVVVVNTPEGQREDQFGLGRGIETAGSAIANEIEQGKQRKFLAKILQMKQDAQTKQNVNKMTLELAKLQRQQDDDNWKHAKATYDALSVNVSHMDPTARALFEQSPHYKELMKFIKSNLGDEFINKDPVSGKQSIMWADPKDVYKDTIDRQMDSLNGKITSGQKLTPQEQQYYNFHLKVPSSLSAAMTDAMSRDPNYQHAVATQDVDAQGKIAKDYTAKYGINTNPFGTPQQGSGVTSNPVDDIMNLFNKKKAVAQASSSSQPTQASAPDNALGRALADIANEDDNSGQ